VPPPPEPPQPINRKPQETSNKDRMKGLYDSF
jgi:hypothetical protein